MKEFWLCFVPLFVAVDAIGVLPLFLALTQDVGQADRRRIIMQSVITATAVALAFLVVGTAVLQLLGITVEDFMIAGGALLFALSLSDMLALEKPHRPVDPDCLGAVPLGVPLITGPAVLTTCILLLNQHGLFPTASAIVVNVLLAGVVFSLADRIHRFLGKAGSRTVSKVASLLLAAIAVMMVRRGIAAFLKPGPT
jgi:multiple antibiotic resistance protein